MSKRFSKSTNAISRGSRPHQGLDAQKKREILRSRAILSRLVSARRLARRDEKSSAYFVRSGCSSIFSTDPSLRSSDSLDSEIRERALYDLLASRLTDSQTHRRSQTLTDSQRLTATHSDALSVSASHRRSQRLSVAHRRSQRLTDAHSVSERLRASQRRSQRLTATHVFYAKSISQSKTAHGSADSRAFRDLTRSHRIARSDEENASIDEKKRIIVALDGSASLTESSRCVRMT